MLDLEKDKVKLAGAIDPNFKIVLIFPQAKIADCVFFPYITF